MPYQVPYRRLAYLPDRRSTRIEKSIAIAISGFDVSRGPYHEEVSTLSISCHGCRYRSQNRVSAGEMTILEVIASQNMAAKGPTLGRVRHVNPVGEYPALFDVAVELELPRNIWGIVSPPEDWEGFEQPGLAGEAALKPFPLPSFQTMVAEAPDATWSPLITSLLKTKPLADTKLSASALPPLLAHLVNPAREAFKPAAIQAVKAAPVKSTGDSLDEICWRLEAKASRIFANFIANFAKEVTKLPEQTAQGSSFEALERGLGGFEQPASNTARRSA